MLLTLLAWFYISFVCAMWGNIILYFFKKIFREERDQYFHFSFICFLGFTGITVFVSFFSLFMPLEGWAIHVIILSPCIGFCFLDSGRNLFVELKRQFNSFHSVTFFLLFAWALMLLVMSSWTIIHPDTLTYHAQTIQWIEKYKTIPGLAHLHIRYGIQGLWFVSCAVFSFKFLGLDALTFINSTVLVWYFIFIAQKINENIFNGSFKMNGFLWLALAAISAWSYSQVRLTATSASPDFIASLFVWAVFSLLLDKITTERHTSRWLLIILFSFFAITLKLSVLPIILIAGYALYKLIQQKQNKQLVIACLMAVTILFPYFARNIISSGYPLFPSPYPDIANVEWKIDKTKTKLERDYIKAYAQSPVDHTEDNIRNGLEMKLNEWIPIWWKNRSLPDKILIGLLLLAIPITLLKIKKIGRVAQNIAIAIIVSFTGCLFWFFQAPDPRFGFGFIIVFPSIVYSLLLLEYIKTEIPGLRKILIVASLIFAMIIAGYTLYRFINFFNTNQLLQPLGIKKIPYRIIQCKGVNFRIPESNAGCGDISPPCIYDSCQNLQPRGIKIEDGFMSR